MNEQTYPDGLKMFTNDAEWVIARDPEDADKAYREHIGEQFTTPAEDTSVWTEEPPGKMFMFTNLETSTKDTFAGWVHKIGKRGYFASENY